MKINWSFYSKDEVRYSQPFYRGDAWDTYDFIDKPAKKFVAIVHRDDGWYMGTEDPGDALEHLEWTKLNVTNIEEAKAVVTAIMRMG